MERSTYITFNFAANIKHVTLCDIYKHIRYIMYYYIVINRKSGKVVSMGTSTIMS